MLFDIEKYCNRLRLARERRGFSQSELGKQIGVNAAAISKYECGVSQPNAEGLTKLCKALGVSSDYLLGLTNEPLLFVQEEPDPMLHKINRLPIHLKNRLSTFIDGMLSALSEDESMFL